jgi:YD repeat-containing protein
LGYSGDTLATVTTFDGRVVAYLYDAYERLIWVIYPDGKSRGFLYENSAYPQALTGVIDESGLRFATYAFDAQGKVTSTEHAGGVDRYQLSYTQNSTEGTTSVTD